MTARLRAEVSDNFEELADDMEHEATMAEDRLDQGLDGDRRVSDIENEATTKRVRAALYRRAAELLRADKRKLTL